MRKTFAFAVCCILFGSVAQAPAQSPSQVTGAKRMTVTINGTPIEGVRNVRGLESASEVQSMEQGAGAASRTMPTGTLKQLPSPGQKHTLVLTVAPTPNDVLREWQKNVACGRQDHRSVDITVYDAEGRPGRKYHFTDCWPTRISRPMSTQRDSGVGTEKIELAYESVQVQ